jgi:hypothetical protein
LKASEDPDHKGILKLEIDGNEGYDAEYRFDFKARVAYIDLLVAHKRLGLQSGWGRWKFGKLIEVWSAAKFKSVWIKRAAGSWRDKDWSGYYVWPRFGFDGPLPKRNRERLPEFYQSAKTVQELFALPGGSIVWKRFGGVLHNLEFDLKPSSYSRRIFDGG